MEYNQINKHKKSNSVTITIVVTRQHHTAAVLVLDSWFLFQRHELSFQRFSIQFSVSFKVSMSNMFLPKEMTESSMRLFSAAVCGRLHSSKKVACVCVCVQKRQHGGRNPNGIIRGRKVEWTCIGLRPLEVQPMGRGNPSGVDPR